VVKEEEQSGRASERQRSLKDKTGAVEEMQVNWSKKRIELN
jgi:hypothetical protein